VIPTLLNYQYRAYPNTNQKLELNSWIRTCQYWYNWQLGDRFDWWEKNRDYPLFPKGEFYYISCSLPPLQLRDNPNFYSQKRLLPGLKKDLIKVGHSGELLDFKKVPSQTLQDVSERANQAFSRFLSGDSKGKKSGKPRFKSATIAILNELQTVHSLDPLFISLPDCFCLYLK